MLYSGKEDSFDTKVQILFLQMSDEQEDIRDNEDPVISSPKGPARRVIDNLMTLSCQLTSEIV